MTEPLVHRGARAEDLVVTPVATPSWPLPNINSGPAVSWPPIVPDDPPARPSLLGHIAVWAGCLLAVGIGLADPHLNAMLGEALPVAGSLGLAAYGFYGVVTATR